MTTTALMPLDPSVSPQQATRVLTIRANLLPQDISDGRRARRTRTLVVLAVVLVLALLSGWYWHAAGEKQTAEDDFAFVTQQVRDVQQDQREYNDLTSTKNTITVMSSQLSKLMAKDAPWQALLDLARTTGDKYDVEITQLDGALTISAPSGEASDEIGSITINGTAPDKKAVAKYMLALVALKSKGFADPFVSTVSGADKSGVTFTITVSLTKAALCGKFGKTCPSGGK